MQSHSPPSTDVSGVPPNGGDSDLLATLALFRSNPAKGSSLTLQEDTTPSDDESSIIELSTDDELEVASRDHTPDIALGGSEQRGSPAIDLTDPNSPIRTSSALSQVKLNTKEVCRYSI